MAAWPSFIRSYRLLGQVGHHFRRNVTVNGTILLHLLVTWAQEHVPNAFIIPQPAFDLPEDVQARVEGDEV
ncbi:hypothetical protein GSI_12388 [Ganoderma sinense ZZ0214-1]|uniref:Uncharacterized protein n=1 Tax=Ganoderma sinense ZZ0214-1 TaxID=1077348 RepID=A0A2G8RVL2_9APHY|nr:hypothetical protein GSI_12388 [Ganoderma sinense ZZ0214-1]